MNTQAMLLDTNTLQNVASTSIDHFVSKVKGATTDDEVLKLIHNCLEAPGIYVFGELLDQPTVKALETGQNAKYYHTLNLFAYDNYREYLTNQDKYIELTPVMTKKIQHLTIVSMFFKNGKCIPYADLLEELQVNSVRNLEDLIIDGLSLNIIQGKLDQKNKQLEVDNAIGRDIKPGDMSQIVTTLGDWCDSCETVLATIEEQIRRANSEKQRRLKHKDAVEQEIINLKKAIKAQTSETDEVMAGDSREAPSNHELRKKPNKAKTVKSSDF